MSKYTFTVFTPTYNRARTLPRVYESLARQTFRDFEWLIVDDGSTDGTEELVVSWQAEADFPIRYLRQDNRGKHIAFNRAVREAEGGLFLTFDSDDACVPEALERFKWHWESIPPEEREHFSAVTALCVDQNGRLVGSRFPRDVTDSNSLEIRYRYRVKGEKWGFQRTDVLRQFPFPEDVERSYLPEGIVWSAIARRYRTRYVNEALRIYYVDQPSMVHGQPAGRNALGGRLSYLQTLNQDRDFFRYSPIDFLRAAGLYARFSLHLGIGVREQLSAIRHLRERMLCAVMLPVGLLLFARDRWANGRG